MRRAGATGPLTLRADSGFWSTRVIGACQRHKIRFSTSVRSRDPGIARAIAAIAEADRLPIDYSLGGEAQVAETTDRDLRLVVRRTRLVGAPPRAVPPTGATTPS